MSHFDDFFKANYRRIVGYVACSGRFNEADVEEEVSSAIHDHFYKLRDKIEQGGTQASKDKILRNMLTKRAVFQLLNRYTRDTRYVDYCPEPEDLMRDTLAWETPEEVVSLAQRVPEVPELLIDYEPHCKGGNYSGGLPVVVAHSRLKLSFIDQLKGAGVVRPTFTVRKAAPCQ